MNPHVFEDAMDGTMGLAGARRSQALGERRAEKMRLRTPRVKQVQSDDGSTSLSYEGLDMSHDLSGEDYVLRVRQESGEAAARARIRTVTYTVARDFAKKEGVDLSNLDRDERSQYQQRFADQHGHRMEVLLFEVLGENNHDLQKLSRDRKLYMTVSAGEGLDG